LFNIPTWLIVTGKVLIMQNQGFKCPVCKQVCLNPRELWVHRQEVHDGKIWEHSMWTLPPVIAIKSCIRLNSKIPRDYTWCFFGFRVYKGMRTNVHFL
jgi:hypothetical protein